MNAEELYKNSVRHGLCPEGMEYIVEKDLNFVLTDNNRERIADLIFWLCAKNVGVPGWPSAEEVLAVLARVMLIAHEYVGLMGDVIKQEYTQAKETPTSEILLLVYFGLETHVNWHNGARMKEFKDRILPVVRKLKPTV